MFSLINKQTLPPAPLLNFQKIWATAALVSTRFSQQRWKKNNGHDVRMCVQSIPEH